MANKNTLDNLTGQEIKEMINVGNIAIEQLGASALRKLMNHEIDMICFGEGDLELIDKCSDMLDELDPAPMSNEAFMNIIRRNEKERITVIEDGSSYKHVSKKRFVLKRIAIVAAAVVILIASTVSVAAAFGVNIFEYINEIVRQPKGTQIDIDGFTFYSSGDVKKYSSIEQLIDDEDLDIMYPTKWPEGISIKDVSVMQTSGAGKTVYILTSEENVGVRVDLSGIGVPNAQTENIQVNGLTYYIQRGNFVSISCFNNNKIYYIKAKTLDDAILIAENMKE